MVHSVKLLYTCLSFRFEELIFKLPDDNGYSPGEKRINLNQEQFKVAVHPSPEQPMVAMAAIGYEDLKILVMSQRFVSLFVFISLCSLCIVSTDFIRL